MTDSALVGEALGRNAARLELDKSVDTVYSKFNIVRGAAAACVRRRLPAGSAARHAAPALPRHANRLHLQDGRLVAPGQEGRCAGVQPQEHQVPAVACMCWAACGLLHPNLACQAAVPQRSCRCAGSGSTM